MYLCQKMLLVGFNNTSHGNCVSCTRGILGSTEDSEQGAGVLQVRGESFPVENVHNMLKPAGNKCLCNTKWVDAVPYYAFVRFCSVHVAAIFANLINCLDEQVVSTKFIASSSWWNFTRHTSMPPWCSVLLLECSSPWAGKQYKPFLLKTIFFLQ